MTIIVPVLNRADVVPRTLSSIAAQTRRPLQLVLVDNGSSDNTVEVLNEFKREHEAPDFEIVITREARHSAGAARNRGLEAARGEWVMFFDSDDTMEPELVESYLATASQCRGEVDVIVVARRAIDTAGNVSLMPLHKHDVLACHLLHSVLATQAFAISRSFLDRCGKWNEELPAWNDLEMGWRILLQGPRIKWIDRQLVNVIASGEASITGTSFHARCGVWEQALDTLTRLTAVSTLHNVRRYLRLIDFRRLSLAATYEHEGHSELAAPLKQQAMQRLGTAWRLRFIMPLLYRHIAAGRRGAARIARLII